jgi:hypothetical protein
MIEQTTIQEAIRQISRLKQEKHWKEADRLKMHMLQNHSIQIFCRNDGTIGWTEIQPQHQSVKYIHWGVLPSVDLTISTSLSCSEDIPLFIATVNLPHYRTRLVKTLESISRADRDSSRFRPITCIDMLRLDESSSIGVNRIVFEGWRQILLPTILHRYTTTTSLADRESIVFIAEDDVRLFTYRPEIIRHVCKKVFEDNPTLQILSLGHGHATKKPSRRQRRRAKRDSTHHNESLGVNCNSDKSFDTESMMFNHLNSGGKIHGSTLLAIRYPTGIKALLTAMEKITLGKRSHFDQFLFHSTEHEIGIAFSDPPLAGWAEVESTLTTVGSGYRREGGGRLEYRPDSATTSIGWISRRIAMS